MNKKVFVVFSGHNERAVISLCRFFCLYELPFAIISSTSEDIIFKTDWSGKIVFSRLDKGLDLILFEESAEVIKSIYGSDARLVYCPTSEYLNFFVLGNRDSLDGFGWFINMPSIDIYEEITGKKSSLSFLKSQFGLSAPEELAEGEINAPCVFKPKENINKGSVYYPKICFSCEDIEVARKSIELSDWFVQRYVLGHSYYLCGYLSRDGRFAHYWQSNLLQQSGGKSIVLAKSSSNPGVNVDELVSYLFSCRYWGAFMMEVIKSNDGKIYFIEINPRFWGPLQLALDYCPSVLELFAKDCGFYVKKVPILNEKVYWYAWFKGAKNSKCRKYPSLEGVSNKIIEKLLSDHDVYARSDSTALHKKINNGMLFMTNRDFEKCIKFLNLESKHSKYQALYPLLSNVSEKDYLSTGKYELERLKYIKSVVDFKNKSVLDIGANTGYFSFSAADSGACRVLSVEGNKDHASFISLASELLGFENVIDVQREYYNFESISNGELFDISLCLNVLHHFGDDFGDDSLSSEAAKQEIIHCLNNLALSTEILLFQMGFNWKGDVKLPLFESGTKSELIEFIRSGTQNSWDVKEIAVFDEENARYDSINETNINRVDSIGEFLNRPLFFMKSKFVKPKNEIL
ncbi:hypothetical protein [Marinobacterium rhizophilum]|uniref:ATP-grasp domain-containing protein n=1 Tax=Marinobacterium rhizophilum TaxID=420402 RepID=A0ABY5HQU4_9GAMM|nr:hypothetical protein [Marinobacterium rhizophilum]UTW14261.1 hypothetical protein KDW95_11730 [Marinobacterium rhizophilum]